MFCYIIAAYGLANMLVYGNGPFDIIDKFRNLCNKISSMFGKMLDCMMCTSANIGWVVSCIDLFLIKQTSFTPFNILFESDLSLWYLIILFDLFFTSGIVWLLHSLQEFLESFKNQS